MNRIEIYHIFGEQEYRELIRKTVVEACHRLPPPVLPPKADMVDMIVNTDLIWQVHDILLTTSLECTVVIIADLQVI